MSSRKQVSAQLSELGQQLHNIAGGSVQMVGLLEQLNNALGGLSSKVKMLEEANDDLERRLLELEGPRVSPPPYDYLPPI
jgi:uncharacterized protein Yka (UPF0111/DUF47 family)